MKNETETTKQITTSMNVEEMTLVLGFANGKEITIKADALDDEIRNMAMLHGLKQKLVDAAAISRDPVTGASATISTKYQAVYEVYQRLLEGQWNKARSEGGVGSAGLLFTALCRLYPHKSPEDIRAFLEGKNKSEQAALRVNPKIAKIIDTIRQERSANVDTEELLGELED